LCPRNDRDAAPAPPAERRAKGVALIDQVPRPGHGDSRIAFLDPTSTGNVLIELAEVPAGH
jgi:hypothetical protein